MICYLINRTIIVFGVYDREQELRAQYKLTKIIVYLGYFELISSKMYILFSL